MKRRRHILSAVAALAGVAGLLLPGALGPVTAWAQETADEGTPLVIREVDTTRWPAVTITALPGAPGSDQAQVLLREDGTIVAGAAARPLGTSERLVGTVLVIDGSAAMAEGGFIEGARNAAAGYVAGMLPNEQMAIVVVTDRPRLVTTFTSDRGRLTSLINEIRPQGEAALWDSIRAGAALLSDAPRMLPNLIVITGSRDATSQRPVGAARASVQATKAMTFTLAVGDDTEVGGLSLLARVSGGRMVAAADGEAVQAAVAAVQETIQSQFVVGYQASGDEPRQATVQMGASRADAWIAPGSITRGAAINPEVLPPTKVPGFVNSTAGRLTIMVLVLVAAALAGWAVLTLFVRPRSALSRSLAPYEASDDDEDRPLTERAGLLLADSRFARRAVEKAQRIEATRSFLDSVEERLEKANVPLRAAEAVVFYGAAVVLANLVVLFVIGLFPAVLALVAFAVLPPAVLSRRASKRSKKFTSQLPDTLTMLSGTLKAGFSLMQGVEAVAHEVSDPMGEELRRVLAEARLGRSLDDALDDAAERMACADFSWAVMAIKIQREVGGNLTELLETVAETMLSRERLRRDVKSLTAEGRMSAMVIGIMPPALLAMMYSMNREYIGSLFNTSEGRAMTIGALLLALFGFWWMKKTIEIEV